MKDSDKTQIGGPHEALPGTDWAQILRAGTVSPDRRQQPVGAVAEQYWKPVYCYLRRRGLGNERAKDLTQGFFCEVVLGNDLIQQADCEKGRFRTFLLTALDRYVGMEWRKETRAKRRPPGGVIPLDVFEDPPPVPAGNAGPEDAFAYAWASRLLDEVLADVEAGCREAGLETHWEVFRRTVVEPSQSGAEQPSLAQLCDELGIGDPAKASNMGITVRRRFKVALRRRVREFVDSDEKVDQEIRELMEILSKGGAGG